MESLHTPRFMICFPKCFRPCLTNNKFPFFKNKNALYVEILLLIKVLDNGCSFNLHNDKTKGDKSAQSELRLIFYGGFLVIFGLFFMSGHSCLIHGLSCFLAFLWVSSSIIHVCLCQMHNLLLPNLIPLYFHHRAD